jgi:hypothetical protein
LDETLLMPDRAVRFFLASIFASCTQRFKSRHRFWWQPALTRVNARTKNFQWR